MPVSSEDSFREYDVAADKRDIQILLVNSLDERYGSTYRARNIWKAFRALGYACTYIESNSDACAGEGRISIAQRDTLSGYLRASLRRAQLVRSIPHQLTLIQKITPLTLFCILSAVFFKKTHLVIDFDDLDSAFQKTALRRQLTRVLERVIPRFADAITTHSPYLQEYALRHCGAGQVCYVPQVVDTRLFDPGRFIPERVKAELGFGQRRIAGYIGTFTEGGMRDFDRVLGHYARSCPGDDYLLLIVGGGPLRRKIEERIRSEFGIRHYHITGLLPHEVTPRFISAMDVCFIAMRDDRGNRARVSLKVLEYLSMGKPVFGEVVGHTRTMLGTYVLPFSSFAAGAMDGYADQYRGCLREARLYIERTLSMQALQGALQRIPFLKE